MNWESVIGLEIHTQLNSRTKAFCDCKAEFGEEPNTNICPVCMGYPGSLPVVNEELIKKALKLGIATKSKINYKTKFDRKNYFYPDIPKNYQITQYDYPICYDGKLTIDLKERDIKDVRINRIHMEEDTGKVFHDKDDKLTLIDYNRAGIPLLEIVTEPDLRSSEEAHVFLKELKGALRYLDISEANMEKGELRVDVNVSVRKKGEELGTKVELKNMNSFKAVEKAIDYEIKRQKKLIINGKKEDIKQETRMWIDDKGISRVMRTKEEAADYRYFPEPDIPAFEIDREMFKKIKKNKIELPLEKKYRFINEYNISYYNASVLTSDFSLSNYFEEILENYDDGESAANFVINELLSLVNENDDIIDNIKVSPEYMYKILKLLDSDVISSKIAKKILGETYNTGRDPEIIVEEKGWKQMSDSDELENIIENVINENQDEYNRYKDGEKKLFGFFMGQVMKKTKGQANPKKANKILRKKLEE